MKKILLIGNGPSVNDNEWGDLIDQFPGEIGRFNYYRTKFHEKHVGSRIDRWFCDILVQRLIVETPFFKNDVLSQYYTPIDRNYKDTLTVMLGVKPSTGITATYFMIDSGYKVYLYGFDHFNLDKPAHYYSVKGEKNTLTDHKFNDEKRIVDNLVGTNRAARWEGKNE